HLPPAYAAGGAAAASGAGQSALDGDRRRLVLVFHPRAALRPERTLAARPGGGSGLPGQWSPGPLYPPDDGLAPQYLLSESPRPEAVSGSSPLFGGRRSVGPVADPTPSSDLQAGRSS